MLAFTLEYDWIPLRISIDWGTYTTDIDPAVCTQAKHAHFIMVNQLPISEIWINLSCAWLEWGLNWDMDFQSTTKYDVF